MMQTYMTTVNCMEMLIKKIKSHILYRFYSNIFGSRENAVTIATGYRMDDRGVEV
jgi:hypothetical protein